MSSRPRVCFIGGTRYSVPLDSTVARKFAVLADICEAFVVAFSANGTFRRAREPAVFYLMPARDLVVLRYATMVVLGTALGVWCVVRHGARIIVAQSPLEGAVGLLVKVLARLLGTRVLLITENHGDFESSVFLQRRIGTAGLYRWAIPRVASLVLHRSDLGRAVSTSTRAQLQRLAPALPVIQFVTWSDSDVFFAAQRDSAPSSTLEILFVGALIPRKGVDVLIEAFRSVLVRCPAARLAIVGRAANGHYAAGLRASVMALGLESRVLFVGELSQEGVARRMAAATLFVLPTYSEGLPRVILEAMAVGTPVVATRTSGIPDVVEEGVTGLLVEPGDAEALGDRLVWALEHRREMEAMAVTARRRAAAIFSARVYREGYREMFEAVAVSHGRATP